MAKKTWNKPRLLSILVSAAIFYIFIFFCWWAYSLLNYNKLQLKNEKNTMEIERQLIMPQIIKQAQKGAFETDNSIPLMYKKEILLVDTQLVRDYFRDNFIEKHHLDLINSTVLTECIQIKNCPVHLLQVTKNYIKRKKVFTYEAIFFVLIGGLLAFFILYNLKEIVRSTIMQSNFVLAVTHELNTPLATIKLAAQTLERGKEKLNKNTQEKFINKIISNTDRLTALVNNILDVTKLDVKNFNINREAIGLKDMIENQKKHLFSMYPDKDMEFDISIHKNEVINGDKDLLALVFSNILSNAVKYSKEKLKIVVNAESNIHNCTIKIKDNGIGIPVSEQDIIFKKFYRVGEENTRTAKGTGLGLFIVKRILKRHNSSIKVSSNGKNGSVFEIRFTK